MSRRVRSRAFEIQIHVHMRDIYTMLRTWVECNSVEWAIAHIIERGLPYINIYCRFSQQISQSTIEKVCEQIKISPTTKSFKQIKQLYKDATTVQYSDMKETKSSLKWKPWQSNVLKFMDMSCDMGTITWVYHGYKTKEFMDLIRYIVGLETVLMSSDDNDEISNIVKSNIVDNNQKIKAIVVDLPQSRELRLNFLDFLDRLRMGMLDYPNGKPYIFSPINVIVLSNHLPDMIARKRYNINIMTINNIEDM